MTLILHCDAVRAGELRTLAGVVVGVGGGASQRIGGADEPVNSPAKSLGCCSDIRFRKLAHCGPVAPIRRFAWTWRTK
jgi:hypothetical protein